MKMGFSGTRNGMTSHQTRAFRELLARHLPTEFHHGDCVGADAQADELVRLALPRPTIHIHPAIVAAQFKAGCGRGTDVFHAADKLLARNRNIVDAVDFMVLAPESGEEVTRSGTWATKRYAARQHKPGVIILPDGTLKELS